MELLQNKIKSALSKRAATTCSKWAETFRVMGPPFPGAWNFKYFPWLREIHDATDDLVVSQKGAQLGVTETALNKTFFTIDQLGADVLYALPSMTPDATKFSASRFTPALEQSPHLKNIFSNTDNVYHKRAGNANLYVCGSRSRAAFKSSPCRLIILDEVDEMSQENIPLVFERVSGQPVHQIFMLSTPTLEGHGINVFFQKSTQDKFHFPCPSCSKYIELTHENLKITSDDPNNSEINNSYIFCGDCKAKLSHELKWTYLNKGKWVKTQDSEIRGFHISQLYSSTVKPSDLAKSYLNGLKSAADEQEYHNSKLGMPHAAKGARVTDADILARTGTYQCLMPEDVRKRNRFITMGVDIGKYLHVVIVEWHFESNLQDAYFAHPKVIAFRKLPSTDFYELSKLIQDYMVVQTVIDKNPERMAVTQFCKKWNGRAYGCEYSTGVRAREIMCNEEEYTLQVDRTAWLDLCLTRCQRDGITFPVDLSFEFKEQLKAQTRIYFRDKDGNPQAKWVTGSVEDHFSHALCYSEIAFSKAVSFGVGNRNIRAPW